MGYKLNKTGKAMSMPKGLLTGALVSFGITILGSAIVAKLIDMGKLSWEMVGYGVMMLLLLSAFLGASVSMNSIKRQKLLVCAVSGLIYFMMLMVTTALFFGGQYQAVLETALLIVGGSMVAALLQTGKKGRKIRKNQYLRC